MEERDWDFRDIRHRATLEAMEKVQRQRFVPEEQAEHAAEDRALPIGYEQTISQPYMVAYMTAALEPKATDRVLEIGTGSGYQAAILAEIVSRVYSVERVPELAGSAEKTLRSLGYENVAVKVGDGNEGWIEEAPFDAVIATAAAEDIPPALLDQLKDGGRMVIPLGSPWGSQELVLVTKQNRTISTRPLMAVRFVPFRKEAPAGKGK